MRSWHALRCPPLRLVLTPCLRTGLCMPNRISENATTCAWSRTTVRGAVVRFLWCRKFSWRKNKNSSSFADLPWPSPCLPDHDEHEDRPALLCHLSCCFSLCFLSTLPRAIHGCQRPRASCGSSRRQAISQDPWAPIGDNRHSNYVFSVDTRLLQVLWTRGSTSSEETL